MSFDHGFFLVPRPKNYPPQKKTPSLPRNLLTPPAAIARGSPFVSLGWSASDAFDGVVIRWGCGESCMEN